MGGGYSPLIGRAYLIHVPPRDLASKPATARKCGNTHRPDLQGKRATPQPGFGKRRTYRADRGMNGGGKTFRTGNGNRAAQQKSTPEIRAKHPPNDLFDPVYTLDGHIPGAPFRRHTLRVLLYPTAPSKASVDFHVRLDFTYPAVWPSLLLAVVVSKTETSLYAVDNGSEADKGAQSIDHIGVYSRNKGKRLKIREIAVAV